jgi:hypothetical protein
MKTGPFVKIQKSKSKIQGNIPPPLRASTFAKATADKLADRQISILKPCAKETVETVPNFSSPPSPHRAEATVLMP